MANQGQRVDHLYPQDAELARLVKKHRDQKDGSSLRALQAYYESKYGKLPEGYTLLFGELKPSDSFGSFLKDAGKLSLKTGATALGLGALTPDIESDAADIPTIPSRQVGNGMGYGPPSLPQAPVFGGDDIPTIPSRTFGNGQGYDPPSLPTAPGQVWDSTLKKWVNRGVNALTGDGNGGGLGDSAIEAALRMLSGLPALLQNNGPSDEERAYQSQATRLLGQQEQRTQFQNPLYEAVTKMAHGLLPTMGNGGQPYPIGGLGDVKVPGLEDLIRAQRRT